MMDAAIGIEGLAVRYGDAPPVLDGLDLRVAPGERVALLGLNGSGKTTLLRAIVGLVPFRGRLDVLGTPLSARTAAAIRRRTGLLFNAPEDQILLPRVVDDVAFGPAGRGMAPGPAREAAVAALDAMGIDAGPAYGSVHALSQGQKQRVALAGCLVTRPELLLLDEPTASLDPPGRAALARLLDGVGATILAATHDLAFARRTCRRFVLIEGGRVAYDGTDPGPIEARWGGGEPERPGSTGCAGPSSWP